MEEEGRLHMSTSEINGLIDQLIPQVLADRDLGNGRIFTKMHFFRLWALSCLQAGECFDEQLLADQIAKRLPPSISIEREVGAPEGFAG